MTKEQIMSPSIRKGGCGLENTFLLTNPEIRLSVKFVHYTTLLLVAAERPLALPG